MSEKNRPIDFRVSGAFFCLLLATGATLTAEPFASRDQNPLNLIHGLPYPASALTNDDGQLDWMLTYNATNTLNSQSNASESIFFDYESHELNFSLNYGISPGWSASINVPFIYYGGGFLDNAIDSWHRTFGLPQASRPNVADNNFHLRYLDNSSPIVDIDNSSSGLADSQFGISKQLLSAPVNKASLSLIIDLPTGDHQQLTGSLKTDYILQVASQHRLDNAWSLDTNLALIMPGDSNLNGIRVANIVWYAQTGIEWRAHPAFDLRIQLNGHSAFYPDSELKLLGSNYLGVFGMRLHLDACTDFDFAFNEDLKVGASPDISFIFSYRQRVRCRH